jgi:hypothetical protein
MITELPQEKANLPITRNASTKRVGAFGAGLMLALELFFPLRSDAL